MSLGALAVTGFFAQWIDFQHSLHAQHVCSEATGLCRTSAHAVFVVGPEREDRKLDELNITGLDGDIETSLGYTNWEKHVVNGVCYDPNFTNCSTTLPAAARVYNWGYEAWHPYTSTDALATSISSRVSIQKAGPRTILPKLTIPFTTTVVSGKGNAESLVILPNNFSTCAYQDGDEVIFHVVFGAAPVEDPTENLTATGEFSLDEGKTWQASKDIFFEDHIDLKNESNALYFQGWQFDGRAKGHAENLCYRMQVSDNTGRRTKYESCMKVCDFVVNFHNAAGYCSTGSQDKGASIVV